MRNQVVAHSDMTAKDVRVMRQPDNPIGSMQWTSEWSRDRWEPPQLEHIFLPLIRSVLATVKGLAAPAWQSERR
jgi:hypothetical protein